MQIKSSILIIIFTFLLAQSNGLLSQLTPISLGGPYGAKSAFAFNANDEFIFFLDGQNIYRSKDDIQSWTTIRKHIYIDLSVKGKDVAASGIDEVAFSRDNGATWTSYELPHINNGFWNVELLPSHLAVRNNQGRVYIASFGSDQWMQLDFPGVRSIASADDRLMLIFDDYIMSYDPFTDEALTYFDANNYVGNPSNLRFEYNDGDPLIISDSFLFFLSKDSSWAQYALPTNWETAVYKQQDTILVMDGAFSADYELSIDGGVTWEEYSFHMTMSMNLDIRHIKELVVYNNKFYLVDDRSRLFEFDLGTRTLVLQSYEGVVNSEITAIAYSDAIIYSTDDQFLHAYDLNADTWSKIIGLPDQNKVTDIYLDEEQKEVILTTVDPQKRCRIYLHKLNTAGWQTLHLVNNNIRIESPRVEKYDSTYYIIDEFYISSSADKKNWKNLPLYKNLVKFNNALYSLSPEKIVVVSEDQGKTFNPLLIEGEAISALDLIVGDHHLLINDKYKEYLITEDLTEWHQVSNILDGVFSTRDYQKLYKAANGIILVTNSGIYGTKDLKRWTWLKHDYLSFHESILINNELYFASRNRGLIKYNLDQLDLSSSIKIEVYKDSNKNGIRDNLEPPLPSIDLLIQYSNNTNLVLKTDNKGEAMAEHIGQEITDIHPLDTLLYETISYMTTSSSISVAIAPVAEDRQEVTIHTSAIEYPEGEINILSTIKNRTFNDSRGNVSVGFERGLQIKRTNPLNVQIAPLSIQWKDQLLLGHTLINTYAHLDIEQTPSNLIKTTSQIRGFDNGAINDNDQKKFYLKDQSITLPTNLSDHPRGFYINDFSANKPITNTLWFDRTNEENPADQIRVVCQVSNDFDHELLLRSTASLPIRSAYIYSNVLNISMIDFVLDNSGQDLTNSLGNIILNLYTNKISGRPISLGGCRVIYDDRYAQRTDNTAETILIDQPLKTDDKIQAKSLQLYPNPTAELLSLNSDVRKDDLITILHANGQIMMSTLANTNSHTINVSDLTQGLYYVRISRNNKVVLASSFMKN